MMKVSTQRIHLNRPPSFSEITFSARIIAIFKFNLIFFISFYVHYIHNVINLLNKIHFNLLKKIFKQKNTGYMRPQIEFL